MATSNNVDTFDVEEDVDVVFEGSPLHEHLRKFGMSDDVESRKLEKTSKFDQIVEKQKSRLAKSAKKSSKDQKAVLTISGQTLVWPKECNEILEIEIAQKIIESELLVQEDQDFISNFILTEEAFAEYEKRIEENSGKNSSSIFSDVLFFSGSIAAVAGTILFLSERTRLATTVAAVLPTALAAFSTARMSSSAAKDTEDKEQFLKLIDLLLGDMKLFKQMVRKSLNLLQGMELMNAGYLFAVNKTTGAASTSAETRLATHHQRDASFPALRMATYKCTVQLLEAYREALAKLMEVSPLADYIDMKGHYIAFVDLECFGIEDMSSFADGESVSIRALKDTVQLALVQQSEYLRRFSLVFCEKVREDNDLSKTGILKQIREVAATLKNINSKLSRVFEYHQAMGVNPEQRALSLKQKQLQFNFVPVRSLYTSLFSTGLHLQNSLLKVRQMEKLFDALEKQKNEIKKSEINSLIPSETQLIEWLKGFQDVQTELNACVGCLEEGVSQINVLQGDDDDHDDENVSQPQPEVVILHTGNESKHLKVIHINDAAETENENFDEVFEAFVAEERCSGLTGFDDDLIRSGSASTAKDRQASKFLLNELKHVLVGKAEEHRVREEKALQRKLKRADPGQNNIENVENSSDSFSQNNGAPERDFQVNDFKVKSEEPKKEISNIKLTNGESCKSSSDLSNQNGEKCKSSSDLLNQTGQMSNGISQKEDVADIHPKLVGFEHFLDEEDNSTEHITSQIDPFCPNGARSNPGKNCFEDNFLCSTDKKDSNISESSNKNKDSNISDSPNDLKISILSSEDDELSDQTSSSSHPSTIRSVGRRVKGTFSEVVDASSSYSDSSENDFDSDDRDNIDGVDNQTDENPKIEKNFVRSKKLLSKRKRKSQMKEFKHRDGNGFEPRPRKNENGSTSRISVSEIRSLSTPDLKQLASLSSPYVSLEDVSPKRNPALLETRKSRTSSSDSSDWGSMDELENFTLKSYRRPLRPAALRKSNFKARKSENSSIESKKVPEENGKIPEKNEEEGRNSDLQNGGDAPVYRQKHQDQIQELGDGSDAVLASQSLSNTSSVYRQKHRDQIQEIRQPTGFDSSLAAQVVARAQNFGKKFNFLQKEEVFGSD